MSLREDIRRIVRKHPDHPYDSLWDWAKGHPDRFKALMEWAEDRKKALDKAAGEKRQEWEEAQEEEHALAHRVTDFRERLNALQKALKIAESNHDVPKADELRKEIRALDKTRDALIKELKDARHVANREKVKLAAANQEEKSWLERKIIYRKKWEDAKKRRHDQHDDDPAQWEDFMAHGLDANVTPLVKSVMAWGYLDYDLTITSLRRNYVPPGGSTTSYHLSGKAGDIAGARMNEFQSAVYNRFHGNAACLELFGPQNGVCLKYGNTIYLGEGTPLENLHDTHDHFAG